MWGYLWGYVNNSQLRYPQMALIDTSIRNAKAKDKAYKLADERGLFVFIILAVRA